MSVIFSAVLLGLGSVAATVMSAYERAVPLSIEFDLSNDGETLWQGDKVYDFVGFEGKGFAPAIDSSLEASIGRRIGCIKDDEAKVWQINTLMDEFVLVKAQGAQGEIYKLREEF